MSLPYLKLFQNFLDEIDLLTMDERGRLLTAMLEYASGGEVSPDTLTGNARILFPVCRGRIDRDSEAYERQVRENRVNGQKGGRPKKNRPVSEAPSQKPPGFSKTQEEDKDHDEGNDQAQDHDSQKEKEKKEDRSGRGYAPAPREGSFSNPSGETPELKEVEAFCKREAPSVDAARFWNHYASIDWTVNGRRIRDWRAKAREWEAENRTGPVFARAAPAADKPEPFKYTLCSEEDAAYFMNEAEIDSLLEASGGPDVFHGFPPKRPPASQNRPSV